MTFCDGLTVERCSFLNTRGLPPSAGIDFEPNSGYNRMHRVVVRDCVFGGNAGLGICFALGRVWPEADPTFDITVERCRFIRDCVGGGGKGGRIVVKDCIFEDPKAMPLGIGGGPLSPPNCKVEGCVIRENGKDTPMDAAWLCRHAIFLSSAKDVITPPVAVDYGRLTVVDPAPGKMRRFFGRSGVRFRRRARIVVYADSPRRIEVRAEPPKKPRGRRKTLPFTIAVTSSGDGGKVAEFELPANGVIAFDAPRRGFYTISAELGKGTMPVHASNCPMAIDLSQCEQPLICTAGDFLFFVPDGIDRFEALVGGSGGECVGASLVDPDGAEAWSDGCISAWCGHLQRGKAKSGLWRLSIRRADRGRFEDLGVWLSGVPPFLFVDPERHWR